MRTMPERPYEEVPKINNFSELLELSATNSPLSAAFSYSRNGVTEFVTFAEFRQNALNQAEHLSIKYKKSHIALIGANSIEWLTLFFAIVLSGNVVVIIDKDETSEKIEKMLKTAHVDYVFHADNQKLSLSSKKYKLFPFAKIFNITPTKTNKLTRNKSNNNARKLPKIKPDDKAAIFFTSGTTGSSKAVMLSQKNICADIYGAASLYRPLGNTVAFLPFHHAFGLVTGILMPYYYGCTTFLTGSLKDVASDIKNNSPQTVFVVPAVLELFYRQIWREARKSNHSHLLRYAVSVNKSLQFIGFDMSKFLFKSIRASFGGKLDVIICGGAYLDPKYIRWFQAVGITVLNGYGITECSPVVAVNRINHSKTGSVGQICRDVKVKIASDNEILVKGDIVMKGYFGDHKSTRTVLKNNWLYTGDLGYVDDDGFLFITGRKKDLIILSNGENISPETIEAEFLHDDAVRECVVYAENNRIIAEIYPTDEYFGDQDYFDNLVYNYNKNKPRNHQVALVRLRQNEFTKNNNRKILRGLFKRKS